MNKTNKRICEIQRNPSVPQINLEEKFLNLENRSNSLEIERRSRKGI